MKNWRKLINKYKSISWVLIAAILVLTLLPVHYHMQHNVSEDLAHHDHVIDFHLATEKHDSSYHAEDHHSVSVAPDGFVKKTNPDFFLFIILVLFLTLFPRFIYRVRVRLGFNIVGLKQNYPHFSPPLRAPPAH